MAFVSKICFLLPFTTNIFPGWAVPFIWATIWAFISLRWCKRAMEVEREEWETTNGPIKIKELSMETPTSPRDPAPPRLSRLSEAEAEEQKERTPEEAV